MGLAVHIIEELARLGIDSRWIQLSGSLRVEAPASILHLKARGTCSWGMFSYSDHSLEIEDASVGRYCSIGPDVKIGPGRHPTGWLSTHPLAAALPNVCGLPDDPVAKAFMATEVTEPAGAPRSGMTIVQDDVWIGANALIMKGVTVGYSAIVGAGAVVTKDVAPFEVVIGSPARVLRRRLPDPLAERVLASKWWEKDLSRLQSRDFSAPDRFLDMLDASPVPRLEPKRFIVTESGVQRALHY